MASNLFYRINIAISRLETFLWTILGKRNYPELCTAIINENRSSNGKAFTLKDIIGDGYLFAVPKSRRTIEKRLKRKFGDPYYVLKILTPKKNLRICDTCGHDHEVGVLCPNCYKTIEEETKKMQTAIQEKLGLSPIENEVIVLYDGEKPEKPDEFWNGKRIVEMKKPRPSWFSKNLLQQTTKEKDEETKDIKPTQLG